MAQRSDSRLSVRFGDEVLQRGHTAVPNLVLNYYARLGLSPAEMLFTIHVWQHWWTERDPHPSLRTVAAKMGVSVRQAKRYVEALERKGFLRVVERFAPHGGQLTNEFDYSPLIRAVVQAARADGALAARGSGIARRIRQRGGRDGSDILPADTADTPAHDDADTGPMASAVAPSHAWLSPEEEGPAEDHGDEKGTAYRRDHSTLQIHGDRPPLACQQLWAAALAALAAHVPPGELEAWLRPARLVAVQDGVAVVVVPTTVAGRRIVRRYGALLRATLAALAGEPLALSCVMEATWQARAMER
jgi:hypothetical protein